MTTSQISHSTQHILNTAQKMGVEVKELKGTKIFQLTYKKQVKYFHYQIPADTPELVRFACQDKNVTRLLLELAEIPIANRFSLCTNDTESDWIHIFESLKKPLVV